MKDISMYNVIWKSQSKDSSESMPLGGHNIGCNVWVENNEVLIYFQQSGTFDENGSMLKQGRLRICFEENPFEEQFIQELVLQDGYIHIGGISPRGELDLMLWIDVNNPVIHIDSDSSYPIKFSVTYENWRYEDRTVDNQSYELFQCKEVWGDPNKPVIFHKDDISVSSEYDLLFYHYNNSDDLSFDREMDTQGLSQFKHKLYNPQRNRIMGGVLDTGGMKFDVEVKGTYVDTSFIGYKFNMVEASKCHNLRIYLNTSQVENFAQWKDELSRLIELPTLEDSINFERTKQWWRHYFDQSFIVINEGNSTESDVMWSIGRNYQLFRYMLGANYYGFWPLKFNGGLFTFDPILAGDSPWSDIKLKYSPDYRLWGGGSHTTQNQRLLYWPMLRSGDFDAMPQLFEFFRRLLDTSMLRAKFYFDVEGAVYPEQIGIYGLCATCDHGWGNTTGLPVPQIKYLFSNQLEIALMILEYEIFTGRDISLYIPFIDSVVSFYDGYYKENDPDGKMIIWPGNALETFHVVKNPIDAVAGLDCLLRKMLCLPNKYTTEALLTKWKKILERVPNIKYIEKDGHKLISPADTPSEHHNCEIPELYTVFPYGQFGICKPDLQIAIDTALYAPVTEEQKTHISWHQQGIQYARLGMQVQAFDFLTKKMGDSEKRFPTFWGPGHDWTPDHNWGGSGMIQLQDMLLQEENNRIRLFPCWDKDIDVHFKLFASENTSVECVLKNGIVQKLVILPEERRKDIVVMI